MAWTEQCKIDAVEQVEHKKAELGISAKKAIKVLSVESGIPNKTIERWYYACLENEASASEMRQTEADQIEQYESTIKRLVNKCELLERRLVIPPEWPTQKYKTIVVDPPWPMQKILRKERKAQAEFDYPKMTIQEIMALPIETLVHEDGAHLYLWTTHKYLPDALMICRAWGFKYQCTMTWVKNVGPTPFSWMYSTELVLFGTCGNIPLEKQGLRLDFEAKVEGHSAKPAKFYLQAREASPEPRIDMFARTRHEGFDSWGSESPNG